MRIEYTDQFKQSFNEIMSCGGKYYAKSTLTRFFRNLTSLKRLLLTNPFMGSFESLLEDRDFEYRKIVIYNYLKLIYLVEGDMILFVDIWDTRQSPETLKDRINCN